MNDSFVISTLKWYCKLEWDYHRSNVTNIFTALVRTAMLPSTAGVSKHTDPTKPQQHWALQPFSVGLVNRYEISLSENDILLSSI